MKFLAGSSNVALHLSEATSGPVLDAATDTEEVVGLRGSAILDAMPSLRVPSPDTHQG
jgi:hypothetical protein